MRPRAGGKWAANVCSRIEQPYGVDPKATEEPDEQCARVCSVVHVATAEVVCHAGGRGFESRRSRSLHLARRCDSFVSPQRTPGRVEIPEALRTESGLGVRAMPPVFDRRSRIELHTRRSEEAVTSAEDARRELVPPLRRGDAGEVDHAVREQERVVELDRDLERVAT